MVTLLDLKIHNLITLTPFLIVLVCVILLEIEKRLNKRIPSRYIISAFIKITTIPVLVFSPMLLIIALGDDALYIFITAMQMFYIYAGILGFLVLFVYAFEELMRRFMKIDIYMDGVRVRWGRLLK